MSRRILTGMRTTGRLHLGHYVGALDNWLKLQHDYDCFFLLADVQALTTHFDRVAELENSVKQVVIDWLSVGLDAQRAAFFLQSAIGEYPELTVYLSMLVNMGILERNPTVKEEIRDHGMGTVNLGFMMYPVSQAADILLFSPSPEDVGSELLVPVGEDQLPHVELCRDIASRFNRQYGNIFVLPEAKIGLVPRLGDLNGSQAKMSKSMGNAIYLSDSADVVREKVRQGVTDPQKMRRGDPGRPEICPIYSYHEIFNVDNSLTLAAGCRSGNLGCVDCKAKLAVALNQKLEPIREARIQIEARPDVVSQAIWDGTERAHVIGRETMSKVRAAMHLDYRRLKGT